MAPPVTTKDGASVWTASAWKWAVMATLAVTQRYSSQLHSNVHNQIKLLILYLHLYLPAYLLMHHHNQEDKCRVCGGDGSACETTSSVIGKDADMQMGYNDLVMIPVGATNIRIAEVQSSSLCLPLFFSSCSCLLLTR